jgi:glycosyltransferase involved in cell wall biosynthesis
VSDRRYSGLSYTYGSKRITVGAHLAILYLHDIASCKWGISLFEICVLQSHDRAASTRPFSNSIQGSPVRLLVVHNYYTLRGGEDVVYEEEASLLERYGHHVVRYAKRSGDISSRSLQLAANSLWNRRAASDLATICRNERIDLVHFHNTFPLFSPSVCSAAKKSGSAVVKTLHNFRFLCPKAVFFRDGQPCFDCHKATLKTAAIRHRCYRDSTAATMLNAAISATTRWTQTYQRSLDAVIVPTQYSKQLYEASSFPLAPIFVKPHFVERDLGFAPGNGGFVLFVGRLSDEKGVGTLIAAARHLPNIKFKIVGTGPLESLNPNLTGNVEMLGEQSSHHVYQWMGEAACLVVPSDCGETFGRVAVEAFSRGTPVICSGHGGQAEIVKPHVGKQFIPGSSTSLAETLQEFFDATDQMSLMRQAARQEYLNHYTAEANYDMLMAIYQHAMESRSTATRP